MTSAAISPLAGIILAGGQSRRFGSDKASALLDGRSLLEWVATAVHERCDPVIVVKAAGQRLPPLPRHVEVIDDLIEGAGPLAGLIAGLRACPPGLAFATSCDAPLLQPALIELLAGRAAGQAGAIAEVGGFRQPLVAVFRVAEALPALETSFAAGNRALTAALARLDLVVVPEGELRTADPDLRSFLNANRPEILAQITLVLRAQRA